MRGKIYDLEEMNRALPLIRAIVADIRRETGRLQDELRALGREGRLPSLDDPDPERNLPYDLRDLLDEIRSLIGELGGLGVFLRDPVSGLVEAYGERDGEIVYYSWKPDEDRVRYWHGLFRSARERRPVTALVS